MQPYRPAPAPYRPGPGALIGGIIAIVAIAFGAVFAVLILTARLPPAQGVLAVEILRPVALIAIGAAIALHVRRWLKRRRL